MSQHITLLGTETVERAANKMQDAADTIQRSNQDLQDTIARMLQRLEHLVERLENAKENNNG